MARLRRAGRLFCFGFIQGEMREHARWLCDIRAVFALLPVWFNAIELAAVLRCPDIMACRRPNIILLAATNETFTTNSKHKRGK
jgi:hypothetical protein